MTPPIDHREAIEKAGLNEPMPMLVDGSLCASNSGQTLSVLDPSTNQEITTVPCADAEDVARAVAAARAAFIGPWASWSPGKRSRALQKLASLVGANEKALVATECLDAGQPRMMAQKLAVASVKKNLGYYAGWTDKTYGEVVPLPSSSQLDYTLREPIGVIAAIIPWNTPQLFVGSKLGPALATGNVVVLKPSEHAPLGALKIAQLIEEAGFPPGVVQVLSGDGETGRLLCTHPGVDKISFTGGASIAKKVLGSAAEGLKPTIMELGGKSANIVFDDANLNAATMMSAMGVFGLSGQACAAGSRLLVQRGTYDELVRRVSQMAKGLGVGDPLSPMTMLGPLNSSAHMDRVQSYIKAGKEEGLELLFEGSVSDELAESGNFMAPHIFGNVTPESKLWAEEIFGPVLCVTPFDKEADAIELANATEYGLGAGIWTQNLGRAHRVAAGVRAGNVWVNTYGMLPHTAPFGGVKQSGWGREGGKDVLNEYTHVKNILMELNA